MRITNVLQRLQQLQRLRQYLGLVRVFTCVVLCLMLTVMLTGCGGQQSDFAKPASAEITRAVSHKLSDFAKLVEILVVHTKQTLDENDCDADHPLCRITHPDTSDNNAQSEPNEQSGHNIQSDTITQSDSNNQSAQFNPMPEAMKIAHTDSDIKLAKQYADYIGDDITYARVTIRVEHVVPMPIQQRPYTRFLANASVTVQFSLSQYKFDGDAADSLPLMTDPVTFIVQVPHESTGVPVVPSVEAYSVFDSIQMEIQQSAELKRREREPWWMEFFNPIKW